MKSKPSWAGKYKPEVKIVLKEGQRFCLGCDKVFYFTDRWNFICGTCKRSQRYSTGEQ